MARAFNNSVKIESAVGREDNIIGELIYTTELVVGVQR